MSLKSTLEHAQQCVVAIIINRGVAGEVVEITVERSGAASKILRRLVCNLRLGVNERRTLVAAFIGGALIGALGGLIWFGGAGFRPPLLIGFFPLRPLEAVIPHKAISLFGVASA